MAEETLNLKDIPSIPSKTLEKYQRAIAKEMEKRAGSELKAIHKQLKRLAEMTGMQIVEAEEEEGREETKPEEATEGESKELGPALFIEGTGQRRGRSSAVLARAPIRVARSRANNPHNHWECC